MCGIMAMMYDVLSYLCETAGIGQRVEHGPEPSVACYTTQRGLYSPSFCNEMGRVK